MQTSLFDYHLPEHLIARNPALRRDRSRLMVVERASGKVTHTEFAALPEFLPQGARLFRNNATVLRARLKAQRPSGGQVECLLLRPAKEEDLLRFTAADNPPATATDSAMKAATGSLAVSADNAPATAADNARTTATSNAQATAIGAVPISPWDFICLLKPGRRLKPGETFYREGHFSATVLNKHPDGENRVRFTPLRGQQSVVQIATLAGELPLPPYIEQARIADAKATGSHADNECYPSDNQRDPNTDNERYQTVYADPDRTVAAAAPTAGLHFTPELLARLAAQGIGAHDLTLHVGLDTFRPISTDTIEAHQIHRELYEIPYQTLAALEPLPHRPRVAVGTTTLRSIEHYFRHRNGRAATAATHSNSPRISTHSTSPLAGTHSTSPAAVTNPLIPPASHPLMPPAANATPAPGAPWISEADIFIYPPAQFAATEALITNFHLPRSTLLCLVSAFLTPGSTDGIQRLKALYAEAIALNYRFYSYGDAMLIL